MADFVDALNHVAAPNWQESRDHESGAPVRWLPLVKVTDSGSWIGLEENGAWVVGRPGALVDTSRGASPGWLAILDHDPAAFREELRYAASKYAIPEDQAKGTLPLEEIVALGLEAAAYVDRSIVWLPIVGLTQRLRLAVEEAMAARRGSQRTRQTAHRLLAELD